MIKPTLQNINRLKDFDGFVDKKPFFKKPIKTQEMSRNNDYTKGNLDYPDYSYL